MSGEEPLFLDIDEVIDIHSAQLEVYGGGEGLRDRGLLESAIAQPSAAFGEDFALDGLFAMAAAYLFHIVRNHRSSTVTSEPASSLPSSFST